MGSYDVGMTCVNAISYGNDSLMRIVPLAFVDDISDQQIAHVHPISVYGCIAYIHIAKGLLSRKKLKDCIIESVDENSVYKRLLYIDQLSREQIESSGYIVDTFEAATWCLLTTSSYK